MILLIGEIGILYFGYLITLFLFKKIQLIERLSYSMLFGSAFYAIALFCFSIFHGQITRINLLIVLGTLILVLKILELIIKPKLLTWEKSLSHGFTGLNKLEKIFIVLFFILMIASICLASYWPVYEWDALALYDFRGRVIAYTGELLETIGSTEYFSHYPPVTSILHSFIYLLGNANPQHIYPLYYFSFITIFYFRLLEIIGRKTSMFVTLILATTPIFFMHSTFAYTNLPYAIYFFIGTIYAYKFVVEEKTSYLVISALSTGLTTWIRGFEPFWTANLVFLIIAFILTRNFRRILTYLLYPLVFFPIQKLWSIYLEKYLGKWYSAVGVVSRGISTVITKFNIVNIWNITKYIFINIVVPWGIFSVLFLAVAIREIPNIRNDNRKYLLIIIIVNLAILISGAYFFSMTVVDWDQIPDSARRMAMIFTPLFVFYIGGSEYMKKTVNILDKFI